MLLPKAVLSLCLTFAYSAFRQCYYRKMYAIKESLWIQGKASHTTIGKFCQKRKSVCFTIHTQRWFLMHSEDAQNQTEFLVPSLLCTSQFGLEKAMAPHSSTLAWKIPWMEEPGGPQSMGSLRVGQDSATSLSLFTFMNWRRKWQPTPVFLPGESQGQGSLVGCRLWGLTESDMTEVT